MISGLLFQQGLPLMLKGEGYRRLLFYEDNAYLVSFSSFFFRSLLIFRQWQRDPLGWQCSERQSKVS